MLGIISTKHTVESLKYEKSKWFLRCIINQPNNYFFSSHPLSFIAGADVWSRKNQMP